MRFEWDLVKAASNLRKHNVSFAEAASVFSGPLAYTFADPDHSRGEGRLLTLVFRATKIASPPRALARAIERCAPPETRTASSRRRRAVFLHARRVRRINRRRARRTVSPRAARPAVPARRRGYHVARAGRRELPSLVHRIRTS